MIRALPFAGIAHAFNHAHAMIRDTHGVILFWSDGAASLYGWSSEEAIGSCSHDLLATEFPEPLEIIDRTLQGKGSWIGELKHRRRDGTSVWVASHWVLTEVGENVEKRVLEVNNDISAMKRMEASVHEGTITIQSLLENASHGIISVSANGKIVSANRVFESMFGYQRGELEEKAVGLLLPKGIQIDQGVRFEDDEIQSANRIGQDHFVLGTRKDGTQFPVDVRITRIKSDSDETMMAFVADITNRKRAQNERESLISSLERVVKEKTILLQEVHHRVKNNLAIISALLSMQARASNDSAASQALYESQRRVESMALVHEHLYSNDNVETVEFGEFVAQLVSKLRHSNAIQGRIQFEVKVEKIDLSVDIAVPCALIINELITNSVKHAFPDQRQGNIRILFRRCGDSHFELSCEDDGIGTRASAELETAHGVGTRIVTILTKQIGGRIIRDYGVNGTRWVLTFAARDV